MGKWAGTLTLEKDSCMPHEDESRLKVIIRVREWHLVIKDRCDYASVVDLWASIRFHHYYLICKKALLNPK